MVKSITNTITKIWIGIDIVLFGLAIYLFVFVSQNPILMIIVTIAILYRIKWRTDKVSIDGNEIQITNWFTTTKTTLNLTKIAAYAFNDELIMGERLLLISDKSVVAKIRFKNYANLNELLDYLDSKLEGGLDGYHKNSL